MHGRTVANIIAFRCICSVPRISTVSPLLKASACGVLISIASFEEVAEHIPAAGHPPHSPASEMLTRTMPFCGSIPVTIAVCEIYSIRFSLFAISGSLYLCLMNNAKLQKIFKSPLKIKKIISSDGMERINSDESAKKMKILLMKIWKNNENLLTLKRLNMNSPSEGPF